MNVVYKIAIVSLVAGISLSGCDDKECVKKDCITGNYIMDVKVIKRPPIISFDFGRPDVIPFNHQIIHDEVMDTTEDICCPGRFSGRHDCPWEYTLSGDGLQIFEHDGQLYFKNGISFNSSGERATFDVLLTLKNDSLVFDKKTSPSIGFFDRPTNDGLVNSTGGVWPFAFDLLYMSIENKPGEPLKGRWVLKDYNDDHCKIEMSDGNTYPCRMGEFAEFTLTKVE